MGGMPSISITFTEMAATAVARRERGIIAMILKEEEPQGNPVVSCTSAADIPGALSDGGKEQIMLALKGYVNAPLRVVAYVVAQGEDGTADYAAALDYLRTVKFDYLVAPSATEDGKVPEIISYVRGERANSKLIKAVLPCTAADDEGIINYATEAVYEGDKAYTAAQYCSRIAGIIAGTPSSISCTYATIPELTDCVRLTKKQMDDAVDAGKLIAWWDGEKVKLARGVNSLTTLSDGKSAQFQKIKAVETMDMISNDIKMTTQDNYIGKYANTYDNKCLLISAIRNYLGGLARENVLQSAAVEIDIDANRAYLKEHGVDADAMEDDEVKRANTGTYVFLMAKLSILDAIEDIILPITI